MSIIKLLFVITLYGVIFYSCSPDQNGGKNPDNNLSRSLDEYTVKYIREKYDTSATKDMTIDTTYILDLLVVEVPETVELVEREKPGIRVCLADEIDKKKTILFFAEGITNKDEYKIEGSPWCVDIKIKVNSNQIGSGKVENYTFAGIYNYADTVAARAKYIHKNSVCKIRIDY